MKRTKKQEDAILETADNIRKRRAWEYARRHKFPRSDGVMGQQYCTKCHTIINVEGTVQESEKMLNGCFVCGKQRP